MRNVLFWEAIVIAVSSIIVTVLITTVIANRQTKEIVKQLKS